MIIIMSVGLILHYIMYQRILRIFYFTSLLMTMLLNLNIMSELSEL